MSGGKSSSKSDTKTTVSNSQSNLEGNLIGAPTNYVTGSNQWQLSDNAQYVYSKGSGDVTLINQFDDNVADAFGQLIDLVNDAGSAVLDFGNNSIEAVSRREEQVSNPELATLTKLMPVLIVAVVAVSAVMLFKR